MRDRTELYFMYKARLRLDVHVRVTTTTRSRTGLGLYRCDGAVEFVEAAGARMLRQLHSFTFLPCFIHQRKNYLLEDLLETCFHHNSVH